MVKNDTRKTVLISLFLALAIGQQFNNANTYRREWANQQKFFWQLTWRAPGIQPNTLLITHDLPFSYVSDFSLSAPLNWIYAPDLKTHDMPYMLAFTKIRLKSSMLPSLEPGQVIQYPYRTLTFKGSTSDSLVIYQPAPGCLRVMDPEFSSKETAPGAIYMLTDAIPLSNLSRIVPTAQPAIPPAAWFGNEPTHTWCYSFEKAELARQQGDWQGVVDLWHESQAKGFNAENPWELLPFTEALARTGDLETAQRLTNQVSEASPDLNPALCQLWQRVRDNSTNLAVSQKDQISSLRSALKCVP